MRKRIRTTLYGGLGQVVTGGILSTLILTVFGISRCLGGLGRITNETCLL